MAQINSANLLAFGRDLRALYAQQMGDEDFTWDPDQIVDHESSGAAANEYWFAMGDESMRNWTGKEKEIVNLLLQAFAASNQDFERTMSIDLKDLERDEARKVVSLMMLLTVPARRWTRQIVAEAIINGGFCNDSAGKAIAYKWIDGLPFFHGAHLSNPNLSTSKPFPNLHTSSPLGKAAIIAGRQAFTTIVGIGGKPLGLRPRQIWIPSSLWATAEELAHATTTYQSTAQGAAAPENVLRILGLEVVEIPELEDGSGTWYMAGKRLGSKPIKMQTEKQPTFWSNAGSMANKLEGEVDTQLGLTEKIVNGVSARGIAMLVAPEVLHKFTP